MNGAPTAMSGVQRLEDAGPFGRAVFVWYPLVGGIVAWLSHLLFLSSSVGWARRNHDVVWALHAATVLCAAATVVALLLAHRLVTTARDAADESSADAGQILFLGRLSLLVGAINLALILLEGFYVVALPPR